MAKRTVKVATWEYRNAEGKRRRAYFGDVVDLSAEEIERGDAQGVFDPDPVVPVPFDVTDAVKRAAETGESAAAAAEVAEFEKPKNVAPKADWVAFRVKNGYVVDGQIRAISEDDAEALTKQELIELD